VTSTKNKVNYRYLFKDIVSGFSEVEVGGELLFIKHLSALDQVELEVLEEKFYASAKAKGLPTEEESLKRLEEEQMWLPEDEAKITEQKKYIESLQNTKKQLYLKSEIENISQQLKEAEGPLVELEAGKSALVGQTCESYSRSRVSDHYVLDSFYKSKTLEKRAFLPQAMDEMPASDLYSIVRAYNERITVFTDLNIQTLTLQDFYSACYPFSDNVMNFFNKPLFQLSTNQVKLIVFTRMFKNIFENYPKIPEAIRKNAEKIIDYVNAQDKAKDVVDNLDKDGASTVMGATNEDYEYLGYKKNPSGRSLNDMLKAKGGRMDMKDLVETMT
tara:strand:+ start:762 stop:1751 length:990 start_codon:yes stop_codon:yes gene_type:complete